MLQCVNEPYNADATGAVDDGLELLLERKKRALVREIQYARGHRHDDDEPPIAQSVVRQGPIEAFHILFKAKLSLVLDRRVRAIVRKFVRTGGFAQRAYLRPRKRGHVYMFWVANDDESVYKIGATTQRVEQRLDQWRYTLGPAKQRRQRRRRVASTTIYNDDADSTAAVAHDPRPCPAMESLLLIDAMACQEPFLAELIVHTLLQCEQIHDRYILDDSQDGVRQMTEFYRVQDGDAVQMLIASVCLYVDTVLTASTASLV